MRQGQRIFFSAAGSILLLMGTSAIADKTPATVKPSAPPTESQLYLASLASAGISYQLTGNTLNLTIEESKVIHALPFLQDAGVIDQQSLTDLQKSSANIAIATVGVIFAAAVMDGAYTDSKTLDQLHVQAYYLPSGRVGAAVKQPCFAFQFTRALFKQAAWDTLSAKDFASKVPGFAFSAACAKAMAS